VCVHSLSVCGVTAVVAACARCCVTTAAALW
jgi:hypothetical protein